MILQGVARLRRRDGIPVAVVARVGTQRLRIRMRRKDGRLREKWVPASLVTVEGDILQLPPYVDRYCPGVREVAQYPLNSSGTEREEAISAARWCTCEYPHPVDFTPAGDWIMVHRQTRKVIVPRRHGRD